MTHNIVTTENYLLVLGELFKQEQFPYIVAERLTTGTFHLWQVHSEHDWDEKNQYKIIAHLPLNNSPILQGVDLLPPIEDEVEKLAKEYANGTSDIDVPYTNGLFYGFLEGYNKAKAKYKYTEEDIIKIVEKSRETGLTAEYLMLSLQQPKIPVGFECEINNPMFALSLQPQITTNPQGLTQWVGEYIY